jgi:hypothetical protein
MGLIMRQKFTNICLSTHTALTDQIPSIERTHHTYLLTRTAITSTHADYENDASQALSNLSMETQLWFLRNADTGKPFLGALTESQDRLNLIRYTTTRDQYRREAGSADRWPDNTIPFAGRSWRRVSPTTPQLNCRILFDKHVHGGNVRK